jgi:hypothetical protein
MKEENRMANIKKNLKTRGSGKTGISGGVEGGNGVKASAAPLSWYAAQPAGTGLTYALTNTGYVILSHKN